MSGIVPKQNVFKFKIEPHKQKSIVKYNFGRTMGPLANGAMCLSTPKHNGKSDTAQMGLGLWYLIIFSSTQYSVISWRCRKPEYPKKTTDLPQLSLFCGIFLWSCYLRILLLLLVEWDGKLSLIALKRCQRRT